MVLGSVHMKIDVWTGSQLTIETYTTCRQKDFSFLFYIPISLQPPMPLIFTAYLSRDKFDRDREKLQSIYSTERLTESIIVVNRPFPSSLVPLFQNESKCETFHMKISSACSFIFMQIKVIFPLGLALALKPEAQGNSEKVYWFIIKFTQKSFYQPPCSIDVVVSQCYGFCHCANPIYNRWFPKHPAIYDHHLSFFSFHSTYKSSIWPDLLLRTLVPQGYINKVFIY